MLWQKKTNVNIKFSDWKRENIDTDENYSIINDSFKAQLGAKIISILEECHILYNEVITVSYKQKEQHLKVVNTDLLNEAQKRIYKLPNKLPMIVEPRLYSKDLVGGYLLNDDKIYEDLLISRKDYKNRSEITELNNIYHMINNVNKTPFKINTELLDYITDYNNRGLLIDSKKHEFASLDKPSRYQEKKLKSFNSLVVLQETILSIVEWLRDKSEFYFPVRLDQRGRVYCSPDYFNYQSNELSKALLLFSNGASISKSDVVSINYLKAYGANCYGGTISKQSFKSKLEWVNLNQEAIYNFKNSNLISKAKNKFLFIAFCIEYKRYMEFLNDENAMTFTTYLPIQLDATCNGFQHMSLLSNEKDLFKELNLNVSDKTITSKPKDFYNFLVHKLNMRFEDILTKNDLTDEIRGSYNRLNEFLFTRDVIKKAVMTIPYNSSKRSMRNYVMDGLHKVKSDNDKDNWYKMSDDIKDTRYINVKDIEILIDNIYSIVINDFRKIKNLTKYLKNIAVLFGKLNLPITWNLPSGLIIYQSYLQTSTISITPFVYSKTKISLKTTNPDKYDSAKQIKTLMFNLIHSLDRSSLSFLYNLFS